MSGLTMSAESQSKQVLKYTQPRPQLLLVVCGRVLGLGMAQ